MAEERKTIANFGQREYESVCYVVAVDDNWFLSRGDDDWCDHPSFAQKYGKIRMANARAADEQEKHSNRRIRAVRLHQRFLVEEIK